MIENFRWGKKKGRDQFKVLDELLFGNHKTVGKNDFLFNYFSIAAQSLSIFTIKKLYSLDLCIWELMMCVDKNDFAPISGAVPFTLSYN